MPEAEPLSPRKTAVVLVIVVGCFAVLWPKLLQPALLGAPAHDPLAPNSADRAQGCCDVIFETDVNAIKIMIELCGNILEKKRGPLDQRTSLAFASGKLPPDIISMCRLEVNSTCGVDISTLLQQNVKLGKTYKQILEEVRSYNSSVCLQMNFGVKTWEFGTHAGKTWTEELHSVKQERPPLVGRGGPHPAMLERGRALPERAGPARRPPAEMVRVVEGRPPPIPGMRPPLGGAGGAIPPPKTSVGLVMPLYTICIVVFFAYTLCKILFKRTDPTTGGNYERVSPDPTFRRRVFEERQPTRSEFDSLGHKERDAIVSAISGLVAEVQQQMEANYAQSHRANHAQVAQQSTDLPQTNGLLHTVHEASPVRIVAKEYTEYTRGAKDKTKHEDEEQIPNELNKGSELIVHSKKDYSQKLREQVPEPKELTPEPKEETPEPKEATPEPKEVTPEPMKSTPEPKVVTQEPKEQTPGPEELIPESKRATTESKEKDINIDRETQEKQSTSELLADAILDEYHKKENGDISNRTTQNGRDDDTQEGLSEEEIEYEEDEEKDESPIVRQLRASVEKENATVKVLGMEMTAHCESGAAWGERPLSPSALPRPPPVQHSRPHEAAEVSSIYLEGDIPQQSRLLVAESETHRDTDSGKECPVVLSGKMTLSLIKDDGEGTPDRDLESAAIDDDFTTASANTIPANYEEEEELSEEEIEEEVEVEEVEVEELEEEEEEIEPSVDERAKLDNNGSVAPSSHD